MSKQVILPKVPSKLLTIALRDLKITIQSGIEIDMRSWGRNVGTPECTVCFAGAVMLQTEKQKPNEKLEFKNHNENYRQYKFLDNIRKGSLATALDYLDIEYEINKYEGFKSYIKGWQPFNKCSNEVFFKQIEDLIIYLKSKNL